MKKFVIGDIVSSYDVVQFIRTIHHSERDFWEGDLVAHIEEYDNYLVKEVEVQSLEDPCYYVDNDLVDEYKEKDIREMPPIVLGFYRDEEEEYEESFQTIDGGHRVTVAKDINIDKILAFVGIV